MAEINIKITATIAQLEAYADKLGYQEFVSVLDSNTSETTTTPNPQTRQSFLQNYFKWFVVEELAKVDVRAIEKEIRDQREADKQVVKDVISNAIAVTFKA